MVRFAGWGLPLWASAVVLFLSGCGGTPAGTGRAVGAGLSGGVHGGQQAVVGASVQLYTVGMTGDGSAATPLLAQPVLTDAHGGFQIAAIPCANTTEVYLTATGGNPGLAGGVNPNLAEMVALGSCAALQTASFVTVNEVTTVAAVAALAPYMSSGTAVGSGMLDAPALTIAFTDASQLANPTTGSAPGANVPAGLTVPTQEVNTLADIVSTCINSAGGKAGDGSACGLYFSLTTPTGSTAPTDTISALLNLIRNPSLNTSSLYNLVTPTAPFQPTLAQAPGSFAVATMPTPFWQYAPGSLDFGALQVGYTAVTQSVTVSNTGGPYLVSMPNYFQFSGTISGTNAADFTLISTNCDFFSDIGPYGSCLAPVSFTPSGPGTRSAVLTLTIYVGGYGYGSYTIALTGQGTPAGTSGAGDADAIQLDADAVWDSAECNGFELRDDAGGDPPDRNRKLLSQQSCWDYQFHADEQLRHVASSTVDLHDCHRRNATVPRQRDRGSDR